MTPQQKRELAVRISDLVTLAAHTHDMNRALVQIEDAKRELQDLYLGIWREHHTSGEVR